MSDFSISSAANERIAARLRLIAPEGRGEIFAGEVGATGGLDAFCVVAAARPADPAGFELRLKKTHRVPEKLGHVVGDALRAKGLPSWLALFCRPDSMVGARICQTAVPGRHEYYFQRRGMPRAGSATADAVGDALCSVFGLGRLPLVGATAASLVTCLVALGFSPLVSPDAWKFLLLVTVAVSTVVCVRLEKWAHRHYMAEDPREVVLDEVAGMALALAIAGPGIWTVVAAFFAFRFFDIFKPGVHWVEERGWPGTIVWDDLLAGLYAGGAVLSGAAIISFIFS